MSRSSIVIILAGVVFCGSSVAIERSTYTKITAKIKYTEVKRVNDKDKYLVYTDKGVYENTDSLSFLKTNSSDIHNKILDNKGKICTLGVVGYRISVISTYPNIIDFNCN